MVSDIKSQEDVDAAAPDGKPIVLHFWASWSEPCKHMDTVVEALSKEHASVAFGRVEAEEADDLTIKYGVTMVPAFIMLKGGKVVDRLDGADPPALADKVGQLNGAPPSSTPKVAAEESTADDTGRIKYLLASHPVILFMKGNVETPRCGFSRKVSEALLELKAPFHTVDILQDEALRNGLKKYSDWPTYPQLYIKGELVGGCDIILEMAATGEMKNTLEEKLGANYQSMSATPAEVPPPAAAPPPAATAPHNTATLNERIETLLKSRSVLLFMKGNPEEPRCGFSSKVVKALQTLSVDFGTFDILSDETIRQGLKDYSKWPTYPQLYVQGELLGGCDIVLEMDESGDLKPTIDEMLGRI
eukprot:gene15678-21783_t